MAKTAQMSKSRMAPGLHNKVEAANSSSLVPKEGTRVKVQDLLMKSLSVVAIGALALAASVPAHAGTVWTYWTQAGAGQTTAYANPGWAVGTLNGVAVTYWGETPTGQLSSVYGPSLGPPLRGTPVKVTASGTALPSAATPASPESPEAA